MSWIAEYDTQGREFPTCVHVTKTTGTMTHGATYVPIEDGKAVRAENAKLRELVRAMWGCISHIGEYDVFYYDMAEDGCGMSCTVNGEHCCADKLHDRMRELGVEVPEQ